MSKERTESSQFTPNILHSALQSLLQFEKGVQSSLLSIDTEGSIQIVNERYFKPSRKPTQPQYKSSEIFFALSNLSREQNLQSSINRYIYLIHLYCQNFFDTGNHDISPILDLDRTIILDIQCILIKGVIEIDRRQFVEYMSRNIDTLNFLVQGLFLLSKDVDGASETWLAYLTLIEEFASEKWPIYFSLLQWCYQLYFPVNTQSIASNDMFWQDIIAHENFEEEKKCCANYLPLHVFRLVIVTDFYNKELFEKSVLSCYPGLYAESTSNYEISLDTVILSTYVSIYTYHLQKTTDLSIEFSRLFLIAVSQLGNEFIQPFTNDNQIIIRLLIAFITNLQYQDDRVTLGLYKLYLSLGENDKQTLKNVLDKKLQGFIYRGSSIISALNITSQAKYKRFNMLWKYIQADDFSREVNLDLYYQEYCSLSEIQKNILLIELGQKLNKFLFCHFLVSDSNFKSIVEYINSECSEERDFSNILEIYFGLDAEKIHQLKVFGGGKHDGFLHKILDEFKNSPHKIDILLQQSPNNIIQFFYDIAEAFLLETFELLHLNNNIYKHLKENILALRMIYFLKGLNENTKEKFSALSEAVQMDLIEFALNYQSSIIPNQVTSALKDLISLMSHDTLGKFLRQENNNLLLFSNFAHDAFLKGHVTIAYDLFTLMASTHCIAFKPHYKEFKIGLYSLTAFIEKWITTPHKLSKANKKDIKNWTNLFLTSVGKVYELTLDRDIKEANLILDVFKDLAKKCTDRCLFDFDTHRFIFENLIRCIPTTSEKVPYTESFQNLYPERVIFSDEVMNIVRAYPSKNNTTLVAARRTPAAPAKVTAKTAQTKASSAQASSAQATSAQATSAQATSAQATSAQASSAKASSAQASSAKATSAKATSAKATSAKASSAKAKPAKSTSAKAKSKPVAPVPQSKTVKTFNVDMSVLPEVITTLPEILGNNIYLSGNVVLGLIKTINKPVIRLSKFRIICPNFAIEFLKTKFLDKAQFELDNRLFIILSDSNGDYEVEFITCKKKNWEDRECLKVDAQNSQCSLMPYYVQIGNGKMPVVVYEKNSNTGKVNELKFEAVQKRYSQQILMDMFDLDLENVLSNLILTIEILEFWMAMPNSLASDKTKLFIQTHIKKLTCILMPNEGNSSFIDPVKAFIREKFGKLLRDRVRFIRALEKSDSLHLLSIVYEKESLLTSEQVKLCLDKIPDDQFTLENIALSITAECIRLYSRLPKISVLIPNGLLRHICAYVDLPVNQGEELEPLPNWIIEILENDVLLQAGKSYLDRNKIPTRILELVQQLAEKNELLKINLVGGAVADLKLGIKPNDYDFLISEITLAELSKLLKELNIEHKLINSKHPLITIHLIENGETLDLDFSVLSSSTLDNSDSSDEVNFETDKTRRLFNISALSVLINGEIKRLEIMGQFDWEQLEINSMIPADELFKKNPWSILRLIYLNYKYPNIPINADLRRIWIDHVNKILIDDYNPSFTGNFSKLINRMPWDIIIDKLSEWGLLNILMGLSIEDAKDAISIIPKEKRNQPINFLIAMIAFDIFNNKSQRRIGLSYVLGSPREFRDVLSYVLSFYPSASPKSVFLGDSFNWLLDKYPNLNLSRSTVATNRHATFRKRLVEEPWPKVTSAQQSHR